MLFSKVSNFDKELELTIAVVAPISGESSSLGQSMVDGARLYVDEVNRSGGIDGKKVALEIYDDHNDPLRANDIAIDIVEANQAFAVLGHYSSPCSYAAGKIYQKYGIPVISPTATAPYLTANNDWYFRNLSSDSMQGRFLANYCDRVFGIDTVHVLFEDSNYGRDLAQTFGKEAVRLEIDVADFVSFDPDEKTAFSQELKSVVKKLKNTPIKDFIFLACGPEIGAKLVKRLKDEGIKNSIIASDKLSNPKFTELLALTPREKLSPGYYSNGIVVATPLIYDSANELAQTFRSDFESEYEREPNWISAYSYDAIRLLLVSADEKEISGEMSALRMERKQIREHLISMNSMEFAIPGVTGPNFFNITGDVIKPISMGTYRSQRIVSALNQLQVVPDINEFNNLEEVSNSGQIIQLENQYFYQTQVVYTGMELLNIHEIKMDEMVADMDFYLWFRYRGDFDAKSLEFINSKDVIEIGDPIESNHQGGLKYDLYKIRGKFKLNFTGREQFDEEVLGLSFRNKNQSRNKLIFVVDVIGMGILESNGLLNRLTNIENWLESSINFGIVKAEAFQNASKFPTLGNLEYLNSQKEGVHYSQFNYLLHLKKNQLTLRNGISEEIAYFLLDLSLIMIVVYAFNDRIPIVRLFPRFIWVLQAVCDLMLLLSLEVLLVLYLQGKQVSSYNLETIVTLFDVLWWLIPAINLITVLKIFVWKPIEKSSGNEIPRLLISTISIIILSSASFGIMAFVFDMKVTGLLATSGMIAAIIGLALQMNLSNIISGITISLEKPFKIGDWVKVGEQEGKVLETNWRTTRLETRDESVLCIPNSVVFNSHIHNFHYPDDLFLLEMSLQIDLAHRPERVEKILMDAVMDTEEMLKEPKPTVDIEVGSHSVTYSITFAVRDYERRDDYLTIAWKYVWNHLNRAGITLASNRSQIEMIQRESPVLKDGFHDPAELMLDIDIFRPFKKSEVLELLNGVSMGLYKSQEKIIRQGDDGESLFIILEGTVEIWIEIAEGKEIEVARMGPGKIFGEMSLLTGEARTATVISTTECRLIEITKEDFAPLVAKYPSFAEELSGVLVDRKLRNRVSSEELNSKESEHATQHLINQIRGFFAL